MKFQRFVISFYADTFYYQFSFYRSMVLSTGFCVDSINIS